MGVLWSTRTLLLDSLNEKELTMMILVLQNFLKKEGSGLVEVVASIGKSFEVHG